MLNHDLTAAKAASIFSYLYLFLEPTSPNKLNAIIEWLQQSLYKIANLAAPAKRRESPYASYNPWQCFEVSAACIAAKQQWRRYLAVPTQWEWDRYQAAIQEQKREISKA